MGMDRRRTGFRLSWTATEKQGEDDAKPDEAASEAASAGVDTMTADAPTPDAPTRRARPRRRCPADAGRRRRWRRWRKAGTPPGAPTPESESSDFLVSLVGAMRGVAESSRDASLADLRTAVDAHIEQLNATSAEKETDLRRAADLDLQGVGDWERDEIERIKSEAETRRDARRNKLDQQLAEHRTASEREVEATRTRLADHERELAAFFGQLGEISDPAAFVAAAKRMPRAPELNGPATTASVAAEGAPDTAPPRRTRRPLPMTRVSRPWAWPPADTDTETDAAPAAEADGTAPAEAAGTPEMGDASDGQPTGRAPGAAGPAHRRWDAGGRRRGPGAGERQRDVDRRHRQGPGQLRRHHQLQAGARARRRRARRDLVARPDR